MASGSSLSGKAVAQFRPPKFVTLSKRKSTQSGSSNSSFKENKRRHAANDGGEGSGNSSDGDDDDECLPMSENQLSRHSSSYAGGAELSSKKLLNAKLERIEMRDRAAQHKDARAGPSPLPSTSHAGTSSRNGTASRYILCMWRNPQTRKHKTWDGDGCIILRSGPGGNRLIDVANKQCIARDFKIKSSFESGDLLSIGSKEIEVRRQEQESLRQGLLTAACQIDREISEKEYRGDQVEQPFEATAERPQKRLALGHLTKDPSRQFKAPAQVPVRGQLRTSTPDRSALRQQTTSSSSIEQTTTVSARSFYAKTPNSSERSDKVKPAGLFNGGEGEVAKPRYDPKEMGSIVMKRPSSAHQKTYNKKNLPIVDVMVNPILASTLRPHQIEGVRFLYERVTGMRNHEEEDSLGAILADDMGLGKTLQTITVIDMLLNQRCYYTSNARVIDRALVVCPVSVVKNWEREFSRWLGRKIKVQCLTNETKVESTMYGNYQVLIVGYDKLLKISKQVAAVQPPFGLLVCDEAHRLKNQMAKTSQMLSSLDIGRRILLSGTPIQNNLSEFHAICDMVAPGLLGERKTFKELFEGPILKSRQPQCSKADLKLGKDRSKTLQVITSDLMLRRTADILSAFLPPKYEQVVFCSPSVQQMRIYRKLIQSDRLREIVSGATGNHPFALTAIGLLRKLCNSPELLIKDSTAEIGGDASTTATLLSGIEKYLPVEVTNQAEQSGKMVCVVKMLKHMRESTNDKVVLVSNFTATLDILEAICRKQRFSFARLDGKTKGSDRSRIINTFNSTDQASQFIFLLSSKAGGVGINLIGANRLILFDSDWNPSTDLQAMARIHRDGQKKVCYIYRMLIPGTMDEKIYQRQTSKLSLSDAMIDTKGSDGKNTESFTPEVLRDIFRLHLDTPCLSHDQMQCTCQGNGVAGAGVLGQNDDDEGGDDGANDDDEEKEVPLPTFIKASQVHASQMNTEKKESVAKLAALLRWAHHDCTTEAYEATKDDIINELVSRQHESGIHVDRSKNDGEEFDMKNIVPGSILYVYARMKRIEHEKDDEDTKNESDSEQLED